MCLDHTIGAVCDDDYWSYEDASVVCQQLGFSSYGQSTIMLLLLNITTYVQYFYLIMGHVQYFSLIMCF